MNSSKLKSETPPLAKIIDIAKANWYWYLISVAVSIALGVIYAKTSTYQYTAEATILIDSGEGGKSSGLSLGQSMLADFGLSTGSGGSTIDNEIVILQSTKLLGEVVDRLNLSTKYSVKSSMRPTNIYGESPIAANIIEVGDSELEFTVRPESATKYSYKADEGYKQAEFGDTINIGNSKIAITTTNLWGNEHTFNNITVQKFDKDIYIDDREGQMLISRKDKISNAVSLSITDDNKKQAEDILNTLIRIYNEKTIEDKLKAIEKTELFIADRINMIYSDLSTVDGKIEDIKRDNNIVDFTSVTYKAYESQTKYTSLLNDLNLQIAIVESIKPNLNQGDKQYSAIAQNKVFADLGISDQINIYNELIFKHQELSKNSGANNPVLIKLQQEILFSKQNIEVAVDNIINNIEVQKSEIMALEKSANSMINTLPTKEKVVKDIMREQTIKEQLYLYLLNKRESNAMEIAKAEPGATIVESAKTSRFPVSPRSSIIYLISFLLGVIAPSIVIFVITLFDDKIYSREDIESAISIPVIGVLPRKRKDQTDLDIVVKDNSYDALTEAFRLLRSNMGFFIDEDSKPCHLIQFTSHSADDDRSFAAINFAISLANTGKKVLLLDLDLRKRSLSKMLPNGTKRSGVSSYLNGEIDRVKDVVGNYTRNLDFITAGAQTPNAISLLSTSKFKEMIDKLKSGYDFIVVDSAPYLIVADARIINRVADMTIWVMRSGRRPKSVLKNISDLDRDKKVNNLSILISDFNDKGKSIGYGYDETDIN